MADSHTVRSGESLSKIARDHYGDASLWEALAHYNGILDANLIHPGQVIELPPVEVLRGQEPPPEAPEYLIERPHGHEEIIEVFGNAYDYQTDSGDPDPPWEREYMTRLVLPFTLPLSWSLTQKVTRITCHKKLEPVLDAVFKDIVAKGLRDAVSSYGGCYNFRTKRGGYKLSTHTWGIAIDLNSEANPMGGDNNMNPELVDLFKQHGFEWGGDWAGTKDPMHFQYCTGY